ncbi:hypothetical protein [Limimaricola sp. AA108-03]|uniref:hypothetical protein n=1 Tax=Limimaricola sp. AA108-03 TaxID=3425945 RepID=UPI003D7893C0
MDINRSYYETSNHIHFEQAVEKPGARKNAHDTFRCKVAMELSNVNQACRNVQMPKPLATKTCKKFACDHAEKVGLPASRSATKEEDLPLSEFIRRGSAEGGHSPLSLV